MVLTEVPATISLCLKAFLASSSVLKAKTTEECIFSSLVSSLVIQAGRQTSLRPGLKISISSFRRYMPSLLLKIEVSIPWATILNHCSSFFNSLKVKRGPQIAWCLRRSAAVLSSVVVRMTLFPDRDKVAVATITLLIFTAFKALLTLFLVIIELISLTGVSGVRITLLSL